MYNIFEGICDSEWKWNIVVYVKNNLVMFLSDMYR